MRRRSQSSGSHDHVCGNLLRTLRHHLWLLTYCSQTQRSCLSNNIETMRFSWGARGKFQAGLILVITKTNLEKPKWSLWLSLHKTYLQSYKNNRGLLFDPAISFLQMRTMGTFVYKWNDVRTCIILFITFSGKDLKTYICSKNTLNK